MQKNNMNGRPMLTLEKEIISKADIATIANINAPGTSDGQDTTSTGGMPTVPPTIGSTVFTTTRP